MNLNELIVLITSIILVITGMVLLTYTVINHIFFSSLSIIGFIVLIFGLLPIYIENKDDIQ